MAPTDRAGSDHQPLDRGRGHGCMPASLVSLLLLLLLAIGLFSAWMLQRSLLTPYESRIYPNVYVLGENLGGLTRHQASHHLEQVFANRHMGDLILSDGHQSWRIPWSEAGMRLDPDASAERAFAVRRGGGKAGRMSFKTLLSIMLGQRGRRVRRDVSPGYNVDREALERALGSLAPELREEPQDAALRLDGGQVATAPGQPGRALAVEATAEKIVNTVASLGPDYPFAPAYRILEPRIQDVGGTKAKVEDMLSREIHLTARGTHNGETFTWQWTLSRQAIATWLRIEKTDENPGFAVRLDETAIQATVADLAAEREADEWGFPAEEVSQKIVEALQAGGGEVAVELTPPPRVYIVQAGDRLTAIAEEFGMPPGLIAERNPGLDLDRLSVGQKLIIPPQEVLTPYETVPGKRIVISIAEQRLRVYDNEQLLHEWPCSTGKTDSPTYRGHFQVLSKEEMAYASQWDLQMPHFIGIYRAGGETYNGIHALPILSNGQRLWAGNLGSRASFGCIVLGIDEAAALYKWAELGVPVIIE